MSHLNQHRLLPAALFAALASTAPSQGGHLPRFDDYPVAGAFTGMVAPVDLSTAPHARNFRTVLRQGAAKGPNFAGHYTITQWGCGSPCKAFGIVDALTGRVWLPPIWMGLGASFRKNSSLLIVDGPDFWADAWYPEDSTTAWMPMYAYYYRWDGERLHLLDSIRVRKPTGS